MKHFLMIVMTVLLLQNTMTAQSTSSNALANLLFTNVKSKLTATEKNKIAALTGFVLSGNKDQPFAMDKDSKDYPFSAVVSPTDPNKDGSEEIFITYGNSYTSGNTGSSINLYIKNTAGVYTLHLGFPGISPDILTTTNLGYPDILVGGPGFEFPVLRWNGKTYDNYKKIKDKDYEKLKKTNLDELSKAYQQTIK